MKTKNKIEEKKLTKAELEAREKVIKDLKKNKSALVKRYGKDAEAVMYGRATNIAKKMAESENKNRIKELIRKSLMHEADIEVDADKYEGEKELGQVSMMMDELESLLKGFDWYYYMSDDPRVYNRWGATDNQISKLERELTAMGYGEDVKTLHNQYAPDDRHKIKEGKKEDVDGDGDIDSKDYLAKRDAAIKKAKGDVKEDIDLGHEDNEPHMIKAELYRIGKYAMELYQMVDGFEDKGEVDFPAWWQSKITKAQEMMVSAKHYLDFELKEPAIDAMVGVASDEEILDNEIEEGIHDKDITSAPHTNVKGTMGDYDPKKRAANLAKLKNFGPKGKEIKEEEVGEVDKLAAKIAKALKSNTSDEDQNNIKQARKAMNDGNIEAAKKILQPYIKEGLPKGFWDKKMKAKDETNESYKTLVNKIEKQGKSEKAAKAIAGAVASYKAKGGGKGPTAKQSK